MEGKPPVDAKALCHLLGQSAVLELLEVLADAPRNVSSIAQTLELDTARTSRLLRALRLHGYVECSNHKKEHIFRLSTSIEVRPSRESLTVIAPSANGTYIRIEMRNLEVRNGRRRAGRSDGPGQEASSGGPERSK